MERIPKVNNLKIEKKEENDLNNRLKNLQKNDRTKLFYQLKDIFINGHIFHNQWKELEMNIEIFEFIIDIVKRYESNSLQLNGYGCWLLERIIVDSNYKLNISNKFTEDDVLELILRILLEHPVYLSCIEILWTEVKRNSEIFIKLCHIIIKIIDELPHPLLSENFACFIHFISEYLHKYWNVHIAHLAFHSLTCLAPIVEVSNYKVNYFFNNLLQICIKFNNEYQEILPSNFSSILPHPLVTLFSLLKEICPLHPESISNISSSGFFNIAIEYLLTKPSTRKYPILPSAMISIFQFLSIGCWSFSILQQFINNVSLHNIQEILNYCWFENSNQNTSKESFENDSSSDLQICQNISSIVPLVELVITTYGNPFVTSISIDQLILFLENFFVYSIETLKLHSLTYFEVDSLNHNIISIMTCLRYFGKGRFFNLITLPPNNSNLSEYKYQLFSLVKLYLPTFNEFDSNSNNNNYNDNSDLNNNNNNNNTITTTEKTTLSLSTLQILAVDVYNLLNGWGDDTYWKAIDTIDKDLIILLKSIHEPFELQRKHSLGCISSIIFNHNNHNSNNNNNNNNENNNNDNNKEINIDTNIQSFTSGYRINQDYFIPKIIDKLSIEELKSNRNKYPLKYANRELSSLIQQFLQQWETNSNLEVCQNITILAGIIRTNDSINTTYFPQLCEVLVELLNDDRHGIEHYPGVQEKCIQLLTDISSRDKTCHSIAIQVIDKIVDIISSVHISSQSFMLNTCLTFFSTLSSYPDCGKIIINIIVKLDHIIIRCGSLQLLIRMMNLYRDINKLLNKLSSEDEKILIRWICICIKSNFETYIDFGSHYIASLSQNNRQLIFRGLSRIEIEEPIIYQILHNNDLYSTINYLKTLSILVQNFNNSPNWYPDYWLLSWTLNFQSQRNLVSIKILHQFLNIMLKYKSPENMLILGYILLTFTSIVEGQLRQGNEEYGLKFFSLYMSELSYLLTFITSQYQFVTTFDMHYLPDDSNNNNNDNNNNNNKINSANNNEESKDSLQNSNNLNNIHNKKLKNIYESILNIPVLPLNPSYEFLSQCAMQTIYTLILFDHTHDSLFLFYQYELLFQDTPLCEVVVYLMFQYPQNILIQTKGISIIQKFLENRISILMLSTCFIKLLSQVMELLGDDSSIHSSFCKILIILANYNEENMKSIVESSILLKWIVFVIKTMSPENGPLTCQLISNLSINELYCNKLSSIGLCQLIIQLIERHPTVLRVQIEGVRSLSLLGQKSIKCLRIIRNSQGEKVIQKSREYFKDMLNSDDLSEQLEHTPYCQDDIVEIFNLSNPKKFLAVCIIG